MDQLNHFYEADYGHRPLAEAYDEGLAAIGTRSAAFDRMLAASTARGGFTQYPGGHPFDKLKVPVLHSVGWFDNILPYSMVDYDELHRASRRWRGCSTWSPTRPTTRTTTCARCRSRRRTTTTPNEAALARMLPIYLGPGLDFFDVFLKGKGDAGSVAAGRRGSSATTTGAHRTTLAAAGRARAAAVPGRGGARRRRVPRAARCSPRPRRAAASARWVHDPADLVPSTPLNPFAFLLYWPDEREVQSRDDVLTFTTEPVSEPLDLTGPAVGASRRRVELQLDARHGQALRRRSGRGGSHAAARRALVRDADPGRLVDIPLSHTGHRLLPGHSLRISVASSDFPLYLPHPGTDENPWYATSGARNEQTLATGGPAASYLSLTVS